MQNKSWSEYLFILVAVHTWPYLAGYARDRQNCRELWIWKDSINFRNNYNSWTVRRTNGSTFSDSLCWHKCEMLWLMVFLFAPRDIFLLENAEGFKWMYQFVWNPGREKGRVLYKKINTFKILSFQVCSILTCHY